MIWKTGSTEQAVTWWRALEVELRLQHGTQPPDTYDAIMRGVERATRGEGVEIDPDDLPIDDDEDGDW